MRMPTFGLAVWKEILDGAAADGANTVIIWMGGAFRSKRFPLTWQWAKDHENVKADFGRELIAHAHRRGIKVLLGFTPFGYDGVNIRAGVQQARDAHCSGYVPSLECYSYVVPKPEFGEPWLVGKRQIPFGFGWLKDGENPYRELPVRAVRQVFREYTLNPDLPDAELRARLGRELFGPSWQATDVDDLFERFRVLNTDRDWSVPGALTTPGLVRDRAEHGRLDANKRAQLREQLTRVRAIAARHREATSSGAKELQRIAQWFADQWTPESENLLAP